MRLLIVLVLPAWSWGGYPTCKIPLRDDGPHACQRQESYRESFMDYGDEPYTHNTKRGWCWFPFGWLCRTETETRWRWKQQLSYRTQYRLVRKCCEGYTYNSKYDTCDEICPCASHPCLNNGVCTNSGRAFTCDCSEHFTGARCEIKMNPCAANPCLNNGVCTKSGRSFVCDCSERFRGTRCEIEINPCASSPCLNNGVCTQFGGAFACDCTERFKGARCDIEINPCASNPCLNNGVCTKSGRAFVCNCSDSFIGTRCDIEMNPCASNPCLNNGVCIKSGRAFVCNCSDGFNGTRCDIDIRPCASNPCFNDSVCTDAGTTFVCNCSSGFEGTRCDIVSAPDTFLLNEVTSYDTPSTLIGNNIETTSPSPDVKVAPATPGSATFVLLFFSMVSLVMALVWVFLPIRKRNVSWFTTAFKYNRLRNLPPEERTEWPDY